MPAPCNHPTVNKDCRFCHLEATSLEHHLWWNHGGSVGKPAQPDPSCPRCQVLTASRTSSVIERPPCLYLGDALNDHRQRELGCRTCGEKLRHCELHSICTTKLIKAHPDGKPFPVCTNCGDYEPLPPSIDKGKDDPGAIASYRWALHEAAREARKLAYPADRFHGRGIVIPAGGSCTSYPTSDGKPVPYFWLAYAAAYTLRRRGCLLPLQFWFLGGELTPEMRDFARVVGAECVDASAIGVQDQMLVVGGWQLKVSAIINCRFEEVLYLDSDTIVTRDPTYMFWEDGYWRTGASFWGDNPDHWSGRITQDIAHRAGLPSIEGELDFDTGVLLVDKRRCWQALDAAKHLADHSEYWGGMNGQHSQQKVVWYGDKTDFHVGFRAVGKDFHQYGPFQWSHPGGFYRHCDSADRLIFQHCAHGKGKILRGEPIDNLVGNEVIKEAWAIRGRVPWADGSPEETDRLVNPAKFFDLGASHFLDLGVWQTVVTCNEYRLPDRFEADDLVLDVGGNVGAFAYAAVRRGASVVTVEPFPASASRLRRNLATYSDRVTVVEAAAWRSDAKAGDVTLKFDLEHGARHTGGYSALRGLRSAGGEVATVLTVAFDSIVDLHANGRRIRFLKLDCEGAEFPILYTSQRLDQIDQIAGEYHEYCDPSLALPEPVGGWPAPWTGVGLKTFLETNGFWVELAHDGGDLGHFFAKRNS